MHLPLLSATQVDEERYRQAQGIAAELRAAMREALKDGYVFVLPTTPGPAPPAAAAQGAGASEEAAAFRQRCLQFSSVASLSGVPAAALPVPTPGGMPLGITLLALPKRDLALAQAAVKLGAVLAEEAAALAQAQQQAADAQRGQPAAAEADRAGSSAAAAASSSSASPSAAQQNGSRPGRGRRGAAAAAASEASSAALACKEAGNAAYKAGRYEEAARQYSAAAQLDPGCAVFYSNRAMAHLKLGRYGDAEADCDAALKLELSSKALLRRGSARLCLVGGAWGVAYLQGMAWVSGSRPCSMGQHIASGMTQKEGVCPAQARRHEEQTPGMGPQMQLRHSSGMLTAAQLYAC